MKRPLIQTPINKIVSYWFSRIDEYQLSIDASETHKRCWNCGYEKKLERCHIIPHSLNGKDKPSNLVLLCKRCHAKAPNVGDKEIMWDWIKSNKASLYDTHWLLSGLKEYELIYEKSFVSELIEIGEIKNEGDWVALVKKVSSKASIHFGQPYFNDTTIAGILRGFIKEIIEKNNTNVSNRENKPRFKETEIELLFPSLIHKKLKLRIETCSPLSYNSIYKSRN